MSENINLNFTPAGLGNYGDINSLETKVNSIAAKVDGKPSSSSNSSNNNSQPSNNNTPKPQPKPQAKPVNIFPNYWVKEHGAGGSKDMPKFQVPVQAGKQYTLSFKIASDGDMAKTPVRSNSDWNIGNQWGAIDDNDSGVSSDGAVDHITFTAPKSGNMPISFIFANMAQAMNALPNINIIIQRITMTQTDHYVPYEQCDNSKQSYKDVTGDAGMDAKAFFGPNKL